MILKPFRFFYFPWVIYLIMENLYVQGYLVVLIVVAKKWKEFKINREMTD